MLSGSKVPASKLTFVQQKAEAEMLVYSPRLSSDKNATRSAHRCVGRWGLAWKIPFTYSNIGNPQQPSHRVVPWLSPKSWLQLLLERHPELLTGGHSDPKAGGDNLESFWACYKRIHPEHEYFAQPGHEATFSRTVPVSLHGDEGRGQKKGHVFIAMLEPNLGLENVLIVILCLFGRPLHATPTPTAP